MIKIEHAEVVGWEHAIRGMRNPLNSWEKSDSIKCDASITGECKFECNFDCSEPVMCTNGDLSYCIGNNDFNLMKRLAKAGTDHRKFMRMIVVYADVTAPLYWWKMALNDAREEFLYTKDKKYWWQMIQLLPSSYNQRSTVMLNYEVLANMYHSRKNHKLDEWREFCKWIESLPYSELITGGEE